MSFIAGCAIFAFASNPAFAHAVDGETNGFVHDLMHRAWGPDHLLAMTMVCSIAALAAGGILMVLRMRRAGSSRNPTS
jgi:hydrogenase/urease accessory protein HupE